MGAVKAAVLRPTSGRVITIGFVALCALWLVGLLEEYGVGTALRVLPWFGLLVWGAWAALWRPYVAIDDGGVTLVNVFRTVHLPWPAIQVIDTKWTLALVTPYGTYHAWAAPAPGARGAVRAERHETRHLPESTFGPEGIRPGDAPSTPSGKAAWLIREHWEELRDAGYLDDPKLEHERAPMVWHTRVIAIGAALLVLGCVGLVV